MPIDRTYKYTANGKTYNIPEKERDNFERDFPDASIRMYGGGKYYNIPLNEVDNFINDFDDPQFDVTESGMEEEEKKPNGANGANGPYGANGQEEEWKTQDVQNALNKPMVPENNDGKLVRNPSAELSLLRGADRFAPERSGNILTDSFKKAKKEMEDIAQRKEAENILEGKGEISAGDDYEYQGTFGKEGLPIDINIPITEEEKQAANKQAYETMLQQKREEPQEEPVEEPNLFDTLWKSIGAGVTRTGAGFIDAYNGLFDGFADGQINSPVAVANFIADVVRGKYQYDPSRTIPIRVRSYEDMLKENSDPVTRLSTFLNETADRWSKEAQPSDGKGFVDMLMDGDVGGLLQKGVAVAGESLPMTLSAYNPYTMIANAVSMAGSNYRRNIIDNPDTPDAIKKLQAVGSAAIEQVVEKYSDPVFKYVGGSKATKQVVGEVTKEATGALAKRILGKLGNVAKDALGEGTEEVISNVGNDTLGQLLDWMSGREDYGLQSQYEEAKRSNPDLTPFEFSLGKAKECVDAFIGGALSGVAISSTAQVANGIAEKANGNNEFAKKITGATIQDAGNGKKKLTYKDIAGNVIGERVLPVDQANKELSNAQKQILLNTTTALTLANFAPAYHEGASVAEVADKYNVSYNDVVEAITNPTPETQQMVDDFWTVSEYKAKIYSNEVLKRATDAVKRATGIDVQKALRYKTKTKEEWDAIVKFNQILYKTQQLRSQVDQMAGKTRRAHDAGFYARPAEMKPLTDAFERAYRDLQEVGGYDAINALMSMKGKSVEDVVTFLNNFTVAGKSEEENQQIRALLEDAYEKSIQSQGIEDKRRAIIDNEVNKTEQKLMPYRYMGADGQYELRRAKFEGKDVYVQLPEADDYGNESELALILNEDGTQTQINRRLLKDVTLPVKWDTAMREERAAQEVKWNAEFEYAKRNEIAPLVEEATKAEGQKTEGEETNEAAKALTSLDGGERAKNDIDKFVAYGITSEDMLAYIKEMNLALQQPMLDYYDSITGKARRSLPPTPPEGKGEKATEGEPKSTESTAENLQQEEEEPAAFETMSKEDTYESIYNNSELDKEVADEFVANKLAEAQKTLKDLQESKPKVGTDINKYKKDMKQWAKDEAAAAKTVQYWEEVKKYAEWQDELNKPEEEDTRNPEVVKVMHKMFADGMPFGDIKKAIAQMDPSLQAEAMEYFEQNKGRWQSARQKGGWDAAKAALSSKLYEAADEAGSLEARVAAELMGKKFLWKTIGEGVSKLKGIEGELFANKNQEEERKKRIGWLAKRENGGLTVDEAVHDIWEALNNTYYNGELDSQDVKNIVIRYLMENNSPEGMGKAVLDRIAKVSNEDSEEYDEYAQDRAEFERMKAEAEAEERKASEYMKNLANKYGYTEDVFKKAEELEKKYAKELEQIASIEDDSKFEEAASNFDNEYLPTGYSTKFEDGKLKVIPNEPTSYRNGNLHKTNRKFNVGTNIQVESDGRFPHVIVTRVDDNGKVVEAIDATDGRTVIKDGVILDGNEIVNQPKKISSEKDQNGFPFMLSSKGNKDIGRISASQNLTEAPVRLSLGNNENGYIHIESKHGNQIRKAGYDNVLDFIEYVAQNFNKIQKGESYPNENGGENQTYLIELTDGHNNTLFVQLSRDGSYWNVNSAGVFTEKYGKNKETIWSASEVQNGGSASADNALQSRPIAEKGLSSNGTASTVSGSKGNENNLSDKENAEKINSEGEPQSADADIVKSIQQKGAEEKQKLTEKVAQEKEEGVQFMKTVHPKSGAKIYTKVVNGKELPSSYAEYKEAEKQGAAVSGEAYYKAKQGLWRLEKLRAQYPELKDGGDVALAIMGIEQRLEANLSKEEDQQLQSQLDALKTMRQLMANEDELKETVNAGANVAEKKKQTVNIGNTGITSTNDEIAEESAKVNVNPSDAQKEAGNYKKGHIKVNGFDVTIENPKGSIRRGKDADGKEWETKMNNNYGYIRGTKGVDGDQIDVYLSDDPEGGYVFVIDQVDPKTGEFDEHKVMYGFSSGIEAAENYLANYEEGWQGLGAIYRVEPDEFKRWINSSGRKTKPFGDYAGVNALGYSGIGRGVAKSKTPTPTLPEGKENKATAKDYQVEQRASQFQWDTPADFKEFEDQVPEMSDEELLAYMRADGNGDINKAYHMSLYDEYDSRHNGEYLDYYKMYDKALGEDVEEEVLENMLAEVQRQGAEGGWANEDRTRLMAQADLLMERLQAIDAYQKRMEAAKENPVIIEHRDINTDESFDAMHSEAEKEALKLKNVETLEEYCKRNNIGEFDKESLWYYYQKYGGSWDKLNNMLRDISEDPAATGHAVGKIVDSLAEGYRMLNLLKSIPPSSALPFCDAVEKSFKSEEAKRQKAKERAERKIKTKKDIEQREIGDAMVNRMNAMGMDVSTDIAENRKVRKQAEADNSEEGKIRNFRTADGKTYGFTYRGKIYLDPTKIDAELPIHEYAHPWCEALRKLNPENWNSVVDVMKRDADTWNFVKQLNPDLVDDNDIAEEMIAKYSGQNGAKKARAEYERMNGKDPEWQSKWNNIWTNISKAIQDFWKKTGDFLNIKYDSAEQVYDQVVRDFANKVNPRTRVEQYLKERDAEYMEAVESGDTERAAALFDEALREEVGNGMTPYVSAGEYSKLRQLAKGVKSRDPKVVAEVADMMTPLIPKDAVLVPVPGHTGEATDMLDVVKALSERTGAPVADVLKGEARRSQYDAKKAGEPLSAKELGIQKVGELPEGKIPVVVDNVVDTGNTAEAAVKALGKGVVVSLADSADKYKHAVSLKSAAPVVTDKDGKVVPLSQRFDLNAGKRLNKPMYNEADSEGEPRSAKALEKEFVTRAVKHAEELGRKLGTNINIVNSISEIAKGDTRQRLREGRNILGWYDTDTGEVYVYMPNIVDLKSIDNTIVHEVVAHKGLRQLLGRTQFNKLCDAVYASMDDAAKERFSNYAGIERFEGRERERAMADEYIAKLAEKADLNNSTWQRIVAAVREFLREAGFNIKMTDEDISDLLRRSYENLEAKGEEQKAKGEDALAFYRPQGERVNEIERMPGALVQGFGSAGTSLNQIPSGMKKIDWKPGTVNVDIGGGRFDTATAYMKSKGVENLVFDPFNRSTEHNKEVAEYVRDNKTDTATCHNVLNVIDSEGARGNVILQAAKAIKPEGTAYFTVYEGDKSGQGRQTKTDSWQNNRPTRDYVREVEKYFDDVTVKNNVITARNPKQTEKKSVWDFDGEYRGNDVRFNEEDKNGLSIGIDDTLSQKRYLSSNSYVSSLSGNEFGKSEESLVDRVVKYYQDNYGGEVKRDGFGVVSLDRRGVKDSISHGFGRNKAAAFAAVPEIIKNGALVDYQENWKGRNLDGYTIVAPVKIGNDGYVGVVVVTRGKGTNQNKFYLHEVILQKNLQEESFKTDTKADSHQGDIAKLMQKIFSAKENTEKNAENDGNLYNEGENERDEEKNVRFRDGDVFISNAAKAVEEMKQEKATPEQWLKMIEKVGGLKAGEDKWLGLSDWLKAKGEGQKSLTKQEVLDYIQENQIQVEDVNYGGRWDAQSAAMDAKIPGWSEAFEIGEDEDGGYDIRIVDNDKAVALYNADPYNKDERITAKDGKYNKEDLWNVYDWAVVQVDNTPESDGDVKTINNTRLAYTTDGLKNKREIALVVPTIKPYKEDDRIHFGDAGRGRAVAWVRFGDAEMPRKDPVAQKMFDDAQKAWDDFGNKMHDKYGAAYVLHLNDAEKTENRRLLNEWTKAKEELKTANNPIKVLVIDEIQSKRHQDARDFGYAEEATPEQLILLAGAEEDMHEAQKEYREYFDELRKKHGEVYVNIEDLFAFGDAAEERWRAKLSDEEKAKLDQLDEKKTEAVREWSRIEDEIIKGHGENKVPAAPFEKNWHELAMKRMLRYAAEHGYDKIAWTKGEQQAERYNIGTAVRSIDAGIDQDGNRVMLIYPKHGPTIDVEYDDDGTITRINEAAAGLFERAENIRDIVGKEIATQALAITEKGTENMKSWKGDGFRIGGEGMKGFYDYMLPKFMDKYGKKWGVKTGEVELPGYDNTNHKYPLTMWSVDVTPEMKESVMKGQVMFKDSDLGEVNPKDIKDIKVEREANGYVHGVGVDVTMEDGRKYHMFINKGEDGTRGEIEEMFDMANSNGVSEWEGKNIADIFGNDVADMILNVDKDGMILPKEEIDAIKANFTPDMMAHQKQFSAMFRNEARQMAKKLNLDVNFIKDPEAAGLKGRFATAKGWYDEDTGKITIVLPNNTNGRDVVRTLLHEGVAHHGLRELFGDNFNNFLDNVYKKANDSIRGDIEEFVKKNGGDKRVGVEEYLAHLAENMDYSDPMTQSWWKEIKQMFLDMMHTLGFTDYEGPELSDSDLRYILWRSHKNLEGKDGRENWFSMAEDKAKERKWVREEATSYMNAVVGMVPKLADMGEGKLIEFRNSIEKRIANGEIIFADELAEEGKRLAKEKRNGANESNGANGTNGQNRRENDVLAFYRPEEPVIKKLTRNAAEGEPQSTGKKLFRDGDVDDEVKKMDEKYDKLLSQLPDIPTRREGESDRAFELRMKMWQRQLDTDMQQQYENLNKLTDEANQTIHDATEAIKKAEPGQSLEGYDKALKELVLREQAEKHRLEEARRVRNDKLRRKEENMSRGMIVRNDLEDGFGVDLSKDGWKRTIKDEIRERRRTIETGNWDDAKFAHDIKQQTTAEERKLIPYMLEGDVAIPPHLNNVIEKIRNWYDDIYDVMTEEGLFTGKQYKSYLDNYVTHIWDFSKSDPDAVASMRSYIRMSDPYTRTRVVKSLKYGLEMGLVPKYEDITDILLDYGHYATETIANRRLVKFIETLQIEEKGKDGEPYYVPVLIDADSKDADYQRIDNNALDGYKVYKGAVNDLNIIFGKKHWSDNKILQKIGGLYDTVGGIMKKSNLACSFFHHIALTETAVSTLGVHRFAKALVKNMIWDAAVGRKGFAAAFYDEDATRDAVKHFVVLGATEDYQTQKVLRVTEWLKEKTTDKNIHVAKEAAAVADWLNKGMDTLLWSWMHDGYKIYSFKKIAKEIRDKAAASGWSEMDTERALDEAGRLVNDIYGGQMWDLLGQSPSSVKWFRRLLLSPDWTISTARQALAPFGVGAMYDDPRWVEQMKELGGGNPAAIRKKYSRIFWINATAIFYSLYTALNAMFRYKDEQDELKKAEEKREVDPDYKSPYELIYPDGMKWYDYTMWGNTKGHLFDLFVGRYEDGSEKYLRWGKQFREIPELFFGRDGFSFPGAAISKIAGKLNPMINLAVNIISGYSVTGYKNQYMKDKIGLERDLGRLKVLLSSFLPYSIPTEDDKVFTLTSLIMPDSKGYSVYKARRDFETAIKGSDETLILAVYDACYKNGIDPVELYETTLNSVNAEIRKAQLEGYRELDDAVKHYNETGSVKERVADKKYIEQQMFAQDYKQIEKATFLQNVEDGVYETEPSDAAYMKVNNANDVIEDLRIKKAMAGLKNYHDTYLHEYDGKPGRVKDPGREYRNAHREVDQWYIFNKCKTHINNLKKELGKGNDQDILQQIRWIRTQTFGFEGTYQEYMRIYFPPKPK